jgi:hypothetical protein
VVLPVEGRNRIRCFADQVMLTHALVRDLDEAVKEIQQLDKHGEEARWKITELEALCKQKEDVIKKLMEEKAKLEVMIQSRDEPIMEVANEYVLNHMGENDDNEDVDVDDGGNTTTPHAVVPPPVPMPPAAAPEMIIIEEEENPVEMVLQWEVPEELEIIVLEAEPKAPQPHLFTTIMMDYEESPSRMFDDLDDLDDPTEADYDVDEWFPEDESNDRD